MAAPSVTYTFTNATAADATQVNQNFTDIINALTDGTKDLTVNLFQANGAATFNGNVTLGNASGDDITFTGRVASDIDPKTAASNTLGDATQTWQALYLDNTTTDGGAIYFDGGSTEFIKANAAGSQLEIGGFAQVKIPDGSVSAPSIFSNTGSSDTGLYMDTVDEIDFSIAGSDALNISSSGLSINTKDIAAVDHIFAAGNAVGDPSYSFTGDSDTGMWSSGANVLKLSAGGSDLMQITASGVNITDTAGVFDTAATGSLTVYGQDAISCNNRSNASSPRNQMRFFDIDGDENGTITSTATANTTAYNTSSDSRLKQNLQDFDALKILGELNPVMYERVLDSSQKEIGFLAQDLYEIFPQAVTKGGENPRTNPWQIDYGKLTGLLAGAVKQLLKRVEKLEQINNALYEFIPDSTSIEKLSKKYPSISKEELETTFLPKNWNKTKK